MYIKKTQNKTKKKKPNSLPQCLVKGLAGEFLCEELDDVLPVQMTFWISCKVSRRVSQPVSRVRLFVQRLFLGFTVADVTDQVALKSHITDTENLLLFQRDNSVFAHSQTKNCLKIEHDQENQPIKAHLNRKNIK